MPAIGLESVLRRERLVVGSALLMLVALAWAYVAWTAAQMSGPAEGASGMSMSMDMAGMKMDMGSPAAPVLGAWAPSDFVFMASMWVAMMIGMMVPSAAPMILLYDRVAADAVARGKSIAASGWFAAGYVFSWLAFALAATGAQWALEQAALLSPMMATSNKQVGGLILLAAGIYQWTPLKDACLGQCRSPLTFIQQHGGFQRTANGSLRLGMQHGLYCIGCCWALMALLFVGGVMSPLWIAGIMIVVLAEKLLPAARWLSRLTGIALVAGGVWLLFFS